jgi:hypothetical protein
MQYLTYVRMSVLGIRDILVRIRIPGSVPLTNGSDPDPAPDPITFFIDFKDAKKNFVFFPVTFLQAHHLQTKKFKFLAKILC